MNVIDELIQTVKKNSDGWLRVMLKDGAVFDQVRAAYSFPVSHKQGFIVLSKGIGADSQEIGIIKEVSGLSDEDQKTIIADAESRYFVPIIVDVLSIIRDIGINTWTVVTDRGASTFVVRKGRESTVNDNQGMITVTDVNENRYRIISVDTLPLKARKIIEKMVG